MKAIYRFLFVLAILALTLNSPLAGFTRNQIPEQGFVPDATTATRIAEAVLTPVFGADVVADEQPFQAELKGSTWIVTGTLNHSGFGGVATVRLSKRDGRILVVIHGE